LAKHLQTSHATWDNIDLISSGEKNRCRILCESTIMLDNQDPIHCGWSQFGHWGVQGCRQGDAAEFHCIREG
jgi:hypothetical protein